MMAWRAATVLGLALLGSGGVQAQPGRPAARAAPAVAAAAAPAAVPGPTGAGPAGAAGPQQTTASFADWTLRCVRPAGSAPLCEVAQVVQQDGRPVAQVAIGRVSKGQPLQLTLLVPPSVSFGTAAALVPAEGDGGLALSWRRCLPAGCIAEASLGEDAVHRIRGWAQAGRIAFADGAGRLVSVPVSPSGLGPALDALGREDGG